MKKVLAMVALALMLINGVSLAADFDGDGTDDIGIFRATIGMWAIRGITRAYFGSQYDIPITGDYDGNGTTDISIFRPPGGLWAIKDITRAYFGGYGDVPLSGAGGHMSSFVAGDFPIASITNMCAWNHSYEKMGSIKLGQGGTLRIVFSLGVACYTPPCGPAYARIYRNGVPVGTEHSTTADWLNDSIEVFTEDIGGWSAGDFCQIYLKHPTGVGGETMAMCDYFDIRVGPGPWVGVWHGSE